MEEMLAAFSKELELRENYDHAVSANAGSQDREHRMRAAGENTTLYTRQEVEDCVFCLGNHTHENCIKVVNVNKRKEIVCKFGRCFKCLKGDIQ